MDVILVTASFNAEVHGTFNGKKTGCGINLLKPENATRFRRGSTMTDLGELTCAKCKTKIAKEMIKSDSKEMKVLLKEERMRAKKGIEDSGIVPLGNTTAKITSAPRPAAPPVSQPPQAEPAPAPAQPTNIPAPAPGAPALDAELAKFAINAPHTPENSFPQSEPEPAPAPAPAPADDFMSQFAIQKPEEPAPEPAPAVEDDFLAQFAVNAPAAQPEPAPAPVIDDVSAALAAMQQNPAVQPAPVQTDSQPELPSGNEWDLIANQLFGDIPAQPEVNPEPQPISETVQPDLSEFIQSGPAEMAELPTNEPVMDIPAVSAPSQDVPVIDDISSALNALNAPVQPVAPVQTAPVAEPVMATPVVPVQDAPVIDDISSALNALNAPVQPAAPVQAAPVAEPVMPAPAVPVQEAPVIDDISSALNALNAPVQPAAPVQAAPVAEPVMATPVVPVQDAPVIDDISSALNALNAPVQPVTPVQAAPVAEPVMPAPAPAVPVQEAPVIDDISSALNALNAPVQPVAPVQAAPVAEPVMPAPSPAVPVQEAPVIDDISSALNALNAPVQPVAPVLTAPVAEPVMPAPAPAVPVQEAPVIDDISSALNALNAPVQPVAPVQPPAPAPKAAQTAPVLDDISAVINAAQPAEPAPVAENAPAKPASAQPAPVDALFDALDSFVQPVQPTAPAKPAPAKPAAPAPSAGVPSVGQVISVPQITGYNEKNEPVFTYIKMRIQSFDAKGQPVLVPLPGQNIPLPTAPDTTPRSALDKNTRLKDAMAAAMETPTDSRDMTPGQRIAAANAAKGDPVSANVSKIATNAHTKATSQVFVNAISVSKEYANQSLTETQGLKQRTAVLDSIEDVLSQFGDNSLKEKKLAEQQAAANVPVADEYKGPVRTYSSRPAPRPSAPKQPAMPDRPLTKSELKAMKKQEKIDAKFQKEMAKRGR